MNWDAIAATAEIIGVIAVVVSLLYLGFQVKQNTLQLRQDNLIRNVRGTLDTNWSYHRDAAAFEIFRRGVRSFDELKPREQAHFHSLIVDLAFYLEMIRNLVQYGLVDRAAMQTNERFLVGILVTPGGREWLEFARDTLPMPEPALDYLVRLADEAGEDARPITELQRWFGQSD